MLHKTLQKLSKRHNLLVYLSNNSTVCLNFSCHAYICTPMLFALKVAEFQSMNVVRPQDTYKKERFYRRKNYAKCTTELLPRALDAPATGTHPNANLLRTVRHEQVKVSSALCCLSTR